jgi:enoyl-CoA hydratase/carnithine racemase
LNVVIEDTKDGIRLISLRRPSKRNALSLEMVQGIRVGIETAPSSVVILGSTDPAAFSAGADLTVEDHERAAISDALYDLYLAMRSSPKILLAAASGHTIGGGAQLLIASDIRIVAPDVMIRFAGAGHGLVVGAWGLPSLVGRGRTMDLCLTMRTVGAEEALAMGLVNRIADAPIEEAIQFAGDILKLDPEAMTSVKKVISRCSGEPLAEERRLNSSWDGSIPGRQV